MNTYYPGTSSVSAGMANTCIAVGAPTGSTTPIAAGNLLLVIQMQDANINSSNTTPTAATTAPARARLL
ncbi:MAG: hypothetical protein IPF66_13500 [Holophagales bacterium]|nr:hypothetical protein [Holophagales bacterium]